MPWYAFPYVVILAGFGVYSAYDDTRLGKGIVYVLVDALVTLFWIYCVFAFFYDTLVPLGPALLCLFALAVAWTVIDVRRELRGAVLQRPLSYDPELSPRANLWIDRGVEGFAVLVGTLIGGPAVVAGAVVAIRAW